MRRDTDASGQGTGACRGHRGQPVCTDLTSDPMQRSNSASAAALWESGRCLSPASAEGTGASLPTHCLHTHQWTMAHDEDFLTQNISGLFGCLRVEKLGIVHFSKGNIVTYKEF